MQIFVTDPNPKLCAQYLDDLRLRKMILESGQLLSNALHQKGFPSSIKQTHIHHPLTKWVAQDNNHYNWLYVHFLALLEEYRYRFNKSHSWSKYENLFLGQSFITTLYIETNLNFVNCTPYKDIDVFTAYKTHLREKWKTDKRPPKWTNRNKSD